MNFEALLGQIENLGFLAPFLFVLLYIAATVSFLPGSVLTLGAGAIFGLWKGCVLVSIGSTLGAAASFLIGRYLARNWVLRKMGTNEKFKAVDEAIRKEGWKIVFLVRLSPIFPFNLMNYAFGLTSVSLRGYFFASWIGMIPGTVMYVYLGSVAGELANLSGGGRSKTPAEWILYGVGLFATVLVTLFVTRIAKNALKTKVGS